MTKMRICKHVCLFLSAWFVLSAAMSGCSCVVRTYNVSRPDPVYVKTAPPKAKAETVPAKPSPKHIWKRGAWEWNEETDAWEWKAGAWVVPPSGYIWVTATYEAQGDDSVIYTPGHWEEKKGNSAGKPADKPAGKPALTGTKNDTRPGTSSKK